MKPKLPLLAEFLKARLSQRIVAWIFLSIIVIEAIILVPSVYRRERELLGYLRSLSAARASSILENQTLAQLSSRELLTYLRQLEPNPVILGGALYTQAGQLVGTFGQPPQLTPEQIQRHGRQDRYWRSRDSYDAVWSMSPVEGRYVLIIRHDATGVRQEFFAFIGRIFVLVLVISVFVTLATLICLERILIQPILKLRQDLLRAGAAVHDDSDPQAIAFASKTNGRNDELGDVIAAFEQMFGQITDAIATRKASEARFRTLVEQAADAFFVIDLSGRLIDVNQQACDGLGYSRQELLALNAADIQPNLSVRELRLLWAALKPGGYLDREGYHRRKDGTMFPVEMRVGMLALGSQPLVLALARDITQRKKAESALTRLAEIGELSAMIVHEVRNPLTTVALGLESFRRLELSEPFKTRLSLALDESARLQRLLSEILLYTREPVLDCAELELSEFARDLLPVLRAMPTAAERVLRLELPLEAVWVWCDRNKLKQVMINLISNACEAVASGDTVTWRITAQAPQAWICVHNGGSFIPAEVLLKLTQPFFTTKPSGNGLGLAITRRIVEAHQGELVIQSDAESGTRVTLSLPLTQSRTLSPSPDAA
ncbi:MAG TPA: PAS domain S-box protein [Trichocoleus sp.]